MSDKTAKNVLFLLTGSIACFKACDLVSRLAKGGFAVQTVANVRQAGTRQVAQSEGKNR